MAATDLKLIIRRFGSNLRFEESRNLFLPIFLVQRSVNPKWRPTMMTVQRITAEKGQKRALCGTSMKLGEHVLHTKRLKFRYSATLATRLLGRHLYTLLGHRQTTLALPLIKLP